VQTIESDKPSSWAKFKATADGGRHRGPWCIGAAMVYRGQVLDSLSAYFSWPLCFTDGPGPFRVNLGHYPGLGSPLRKASPARSSHSSPVACRPNHPFRRPLRSGVLSGLRRFMYPEKPRRRSAPLDNTGRSGRLHPVPSLTHSMRLVPTFFGEPGLLTVINLPARGCCRCW